MEEIWKDIKGYEGLYQISNLGNVKALEKQCWNGGAWWTMKEKLLKPTKTNYGYFMISLYKGGKRCRKKFLVHRLVADEFIPNIDSKPYINHLNHIRTDNRLENLEWITQRENCSHAKLASGNKTGYNNVIREPRNDTYRFSIRVEKKRIYKGPFPSPQLAHEAYLQFLKDNNITIKYATVKS